MSIPVVIQALQKIGDNIIWVEVSELMELNEAFAQIEKFKLDYPENRYRIVTQRELEKLK
jgi:hypothetical protein